MPMISATKRLQQYSFSSFKTKNNLGGGMDETVPARELPDPPEGPCVLFKGPEENSHLVRNDRTAQLTDDAQPPRGSVNRQHMGVCHCSAVWFCPHPPHPPPSLLKQTSQAENRRDNYQTQSCRKHQLKEAQTTADFLNKA